jgi:hypothetical protein
LKVLVGTLTFGVLFLAALVWAVYAMKHSRALAKTGPLPVYIGLVSAAISASIFALKVQSLVH